MASATVFLAVLDRGVGGRRAVCAEEGAITAAVAELDASLITKALKVPFLGRPAALPLARQRALHQHVLTAIIPAEAGLVTGTAPIGHCIRQSDLSTAELTGLRRALYVVVGAAVIESLAVVVAIAPLGRSRRREGGKGRKVCVCVCVCMCVICGRRV